MTCESKLFVERAYDITLSISTDADFSVSDISDLTVTLTNRSDNLILAEFVKSGGQIDITGSVITLMILETDITVSGYYNIKIDMLDVGGKLRGITPCPSILRFYD